LWDSKYLKMMLRFPRPAAFALLAASVLAAPAFAATPPPTTAAQIPNLSIVKAEIVAYYASGTYEREASGVAAAAQAYVDERVREHARRPAIVLDIDDTALSDYPYEAAHDFGYGPASYDAAVAAESFPAIAPTLHLAQHAKAEGVAVIFVTGRRTPERAVTLANLLNVGYPQPDGLMLRPVGDHASSVIPFKSHARAQVQAAGYTVLISMGDQRSDLTGGHAERTFKLPNPMYFIP
jgi:predicted secreted acid phosphatase